MRRSQLLGFTLGKVLSPEADRLTIFGKDFDVPSNVAIPKQKESFKFEM